MRKHVDLEPDTGQTLKSQNVEFLHQKYIYECTKAFRKAGNQVYLLILDNFQAPRSWSAFPIRIRIQDNQIVADPDPQHCFNQYTWCLSLVKNHLDTSSSMVLASDVIMDRATVYCVELLTIVM